MKPDYSVLILDDETAITTGIKTFLEELEMQVFAANHINDALRILETNEIDLLLLDIHLPEMDGISFLKKVKPIFERLQVIMISAYSDHKLVVEAMREGADDFIRKPFQLSDIHLAITRTHSFQQTKSQLARTDSKLRRYHTLIENQHRQPIVYKSRQMEEIVKLSEMIAKIEDVPVLISGESGTGKEVLARYIHQMSKRNREAFIPTNCASIPFDLFESEFFGHMKGAFTGAVEDQTGLFELASDGMLFLDEISEMDIRLQAKLLRVLESKEIKKIGGKKIISIGTRVIAATNKDLPKAILDGQFRNDLFHRLSVFELKIPPLRERIDDIPVLFEHFVSKSANRIKKPIKSYDPAIVEQLLKYPFPGNVRELGNMVERAVILSQSEVLCLNDFGLAKLSIEELNEPEKAESGKNKSDLNLNRHEESIVKEALELSSGNIHEAARKLGITPQSLRRRMEKHGML